MSQRDVGVAQLKRRMGVAVQREQATGSERRLRQRVIKILPGRIAVNLDGDPGACRRRKHHRPIGHDAGT